MCCGCSRFAKIIWCFVIGALLLIIGLLTHLLWPTIKNSVLQSQLQLIEGSTNYENWVKTPFPLYLEIYLFDWTNTDKIEDWRIERPKFVEKGPYVFEELHERVDIKYNDDETMVAFNTTKTWWFRPELSKGSLDDVITTLNPMSASINYLARLAPDLNLKILMNQLIEMHNGIFKTTTVKEWLFEGFKDPILDFVHENKESLPGVIPDIPYTQFGWFVDRNTSSSFDGRFEMYTGTDDLKNLGMIESWKGNDTLPYYEGKCASLEGTTGELWPPMNTKDNQEATMFIPDVCRTLTLQKQGSYSNHGLDGLKWAGTDALFDNGNKYPEAECWCTADKEECPALRAGLFNVSACQYGAPAFVSYPHFYLADPSYLIDVEGLSPSKEKHELYIALEPTLGVPIEVRARMQINLFLRQDKDLTYFGNVPNLFVPVIWFTQSADIPDDKSSEIGVLFTMEKVVIIVGYVLYGISALFIIAGIILAIVDCRKGKSTPHSA